MVARVGFEPTASRLWAWRATGLLHLAMLWRRSWDSNPGAACTTYRFSRPDPSATWVLLHYYWWTLKDSNLRPPGYEPEALTNWAKGPKVVARVGLEPTTYRVWTDRSSQLSYLAIRNIFNGRDGRIRTCDTLIPNQVLYQAELHPE